MTDQAGSLDDLKHFIVVPLDKGKLETVLGRVNLQNAGLGITIQTVDIATLDLDEVDRLVQSANDTVVTAKLSACKAFTTWKETYPFRREYLTWFKVE